MTGDTAAGHVPGPTSRVVPVLLLTGPVGVGKSTIGLQVARLLDLAGLAGAFVDLAWIGECWPAPPGDRWNERIIHRNLAAMWRNIHDQGAERLILCRVLETRSLLNPIRRAVPGAAITVGRLRAPLSVLHARIRARDPDPDWYLDAASYLAASLEHAGAEDFVIDNTNRSPRDVAADVLRRASWLDGADH
jgi:adenylylsulfate kinase